MQRDKLKYIAIIIAMLTLMVAIVGAIIALLAWRLPVPPPLPPDQAPAPTATPITEPTPPPVIEERPSPTPLPENDDTDEYELFVNLLNNYEPVRSERWNVNVMQANVELTGLLHGSLPGQVGFGSWAEYFVGENYSILRGVVSANEHFPPSARIRFRVFADGDLAYESDGYIQRASEFSFEARISGAQFILIEVSSYSTRTEARGNFWVSDLILER